ncbi:Lambda-like minor tail protein L [Cylindrospermopsis raciborskii virus RM-2018a]|nr:Lambda-like minor tail protein L [Cylindrospermopsis raciborskii virus RM-2018a]
MINLLSLNPDSFVELYEFYKFYWDTSKSGTNKWADDTVIRICNFIKEDNSIPGLSFENNLYYALGIQGEGFDLIGQGAIPTPTITVSNVGGILTSWLRETRINDKYRLEGTYVKRRVTQKRFLDGESNAGDSIKELPFQVYVIEQLQEENYQTVKFKLTTPFDTDGITLPARIMSRSCPWIYHGGECGYPIDAQKYDINNQPTNDSNQDICAKTLKACEIRFGIFSTLPFGGFPGLNTYS